MPKRDAWIQVVPEDQAEGRLAELYAANTDPVHGVVDNILKVHSLQPESLADHVQMYRTIMHGPGKLTRPEREMIAVVVSGINGCYY